MNFPIKLQSDFGESLLSMIIITLGIVMIVALVYFIFLPFGDMVADQLQSQNTNIYYSSI